MVDMRRWLRHNWKTVVIVATPLLLSPLLAIHTSKKEPQCGYVVLVMAVYWLTAAVPLSVTALVPVVGYPLLGVLSTADTTAQYLKATAMMFMGGLIIAVAVEHSGLHRRIALFVILKVGQSLRRLLVGVMLVSLLLSMWIANTAATAMMVPIVDALLHQLFEGEDEKPSKQNTDNDKITSASTYNDKRISSSSYSRMAEDDDFSAGVVTCKLSTEVVDLNGEDTKYTEIKISPSLENCYDEESFQKVPSRIESDEEVCDGELKTRLVEDQGAGRKRNVPLEVSEEKKKIIKVMFMLGTAYASNLGGTAFPIGAGPNLVLWGVVENSFGENTGLNFASWMMFHWPVVFLATAITAAILDAMFAGWGRWRKVPPSTPETQQRIKQLVQRSYLALGPFTFHEAAVCVCFSCLVLLWLLRKPGFMNGWAYYLNSDTEVGNATPAMLIAVILFALPSRLNFGPFKTGGKGGGGRAPRCLTWQVVQEKLPWGVLLLIGGGFAMAEGTDKSGLSDALGVQLGRLRGLNPALIVVLVVVFSTSITELVSNMTMSNMSTPVVRDLALAVGVNPLLLMIPNTSACSYALMMPMSNPPNAIVHTACNMDTKYMVYAGLVVKITSISVLLAFLFTLGVPIFSLDEDMPTWVNATRNATITV